MRTLRVIALAAAMAAASVAVHAATPPVTDAMIENDAKSSNDVLTWGMGTQGQRFSTLTKINTKNVSQLVPAWSFSFGGEKQRGQESQPLIYNGKMFVTASYSRIYAIDLKTGKKLWKYEQRLPEGIMPCCDVVNRGAALYDNLVIFSTLDAQLIALNQDTGKIVWKDKIEDYAAGYSTTAAPLIVKGMVLTGVSGELQENGMAASTNTSGRIAKATDYNKQSADNNSLRLNGCDPTNVASLNGTALMNAMGNIGVNIAAGAGNLQHNGLAIATAKAAN